MLNGNKPRSPAKACLGWLCAGPGSNDARDEKKGGTRC